MTDAFNEGFNAYWLEMNEDENPYSEGTNEYDDWQAGWRDADEEVLSRNADA